METTQQPEGYEDAIIYKRLIFEINVLRDELEKHSSANKAQMEILLKLLQNSRKYFYLISSYLYPLNI